MKSQNNLRGSSDFGNKNFQKGNLDGGLEDKNRYSKPKNYMVAVTYSEKNQDKNLNPDEAVLNEKIYWTAFTINKSTNFAEL